MTRPVYFIYALLVFPSVFCGCNDTETDTEPPTLTTSFQDNDTLYITARDTNMFTVEMQDNEALSTLKVHLKCRAGIDTLSRDSTSAALQRSVYMWSLYNAKAAAVTDTFSIQTVATYKNQRYPVSAGDTSMYELVVGCIDRAGNYDSIVYKVNLVYSAKK
jgi:hypothetical protein